jgi:3-oxoacyl-[acyl-carrier-protein] synthase-3
MSDPVHIATAHLLRRLNEAAHRPNKEAPPFNDPNTPFADALDSMAMVEFLAVLAEDYGVTAGAIEECVGRRFGTIAELAASLHTVGWEPGGSSQAPISAPAAPTPATLPLGWLAATTARLPQTIQTAQFMNKALGRPPGWLERHAGIEQKGVWADEDAIAVAAEAGRTCLEQAGLKAENVEGLLVTSEAPPLWMGLAAALHHRLRLGTNVVALDIGGACTGFLSALWTAQALLSQKAAVLVLTVESPTNYLRLQPGPAGENAALFGDAAAAAVLCREAPVPEAVPLSPVVLGVDGSGAGLLQVELSNFAVEFRMRRIELAGRAIEAMATSVRNLASRHGLQPADLAGVVAHGGNGRLPGLLARTLGLSQDRVWSETPRTGNLGSPRPTTLHPFRQVGSRFGGMTTGRLRLKREIWPFAAPLPLARRLCPSKPINLAPERQFVENSSDPSSPGIANPGVSGQASGRVSFGDCLLGRQGHKRAHLMPKPRARRLPLAQLIIEPNQAVQLRVVVERSRGKPAALRLFIGPVWSFVPAKALQCGKYDDLVKIHRAIKRNPWIRCRRRGQRRLDVNPADWYQFVTQDKSPGNAIDDLPKEVMDVPLKDLGEAYIELTALKLKQAQQEKAKRGKDRQILQ